MQRLPVHFCVAMTSLCSLSGAELAQSQFERYFLEVDGAEYASTPLIAMMTAPPARGRDGRTGSLDGPRRMSDASAALRIDVR
jgi:hypothetical protein